MHDPSTGEPTGALKEDGADDLMEHVLPKPTRDERLTALRAGMHEANKVGLVEEFVREILGRTSPTATLRMPTCTTN